MNGSNNIERQRGTVMVMGLRGTFTCVFRCVCVIYIYYICTIAAKEAVHQQLEKHTQPLQTHNAIDRYVIRRWSRK